MLAYKIFLLFSILGIFSEVMFTGIKQGLFKKSLMLEGTSYVWMVPIYGSAGLVVKFLHAIFFHHSFLFRGLIYGVYIIVGEFIAGSVLKLLLGRCPWHYEARFAVKNVIRIDYLPVWFVFGLLIEKVLMIIR